MLTADDAGTRAHVGVDMPAQRRVPVVVGGCGPARKSCALERLSPTLWSSNHRSSKMKKKKKDLSEHPGDSLGDKAQASQLSFSKAFTWRAWKHLLGAPCDGRGFRPHESRAPYCSAACFLVHCALEVRRNERRSPLAEVRESDRKRHCPQPLA